MTPLQRERLAAAVATIIEADPETRHPGRLADRLAVAFVDGGTPFAVQADVLAQARSWSVIVRRNDDREAMGRARDAIGLLWAVAEGEP